MNPFLASSMVKRRVIFLVHVPKSVKIRTLYICNSYYNTHTCMCTIHACTRAHTHMHMHTHHTRTEAHVHKHARTRAHTCKHVYTNALSLASKHH